MGAALAEALDVRFADADDLHSATNRAKMAAGTALTDADRQPWLDAVGRTFASASTAGLVIACSALRRVYRDRIRAIAPSVVFVHLTGSRELLQTRIAARTDHFMPASLLDSQLATLEPLADTEIGFGVPIDGPQRSVVAEILRRLQG